MLLYDIFFIKVWFILKKVCSISYYSYAEISVLFLYILVCQCVIMHRPNQDVHVNVGG